jgi:hypothetical protein
MSFDAQAARALARRSHDAAQHLAELKRAIVEAAQQGGFSATVQLPDPQLVPAGQGVNTADFLIGHLQARGLAAWAEAVVQALRAEYEVRPSWRPVGMGAGCDGVTLSWSMASEEPEGPMQLMSAADAYRMSMAAPAQDQCEARALQGERRAATQGGTLCTVRDSAPLNADAWPRRRELLKAAGFTTELAATENGTDLVIRW